MNVHYSSADTEWETPQALFDALNKEFRFTIDLAAGDRNARLKRYITPAMDAFRYRWSGRGFLNPPYGRTLARWVEKAYWSVHVDKTSELVVMLIPARTDTSYWHDWIFGRKAQEIRFLRGRLVFELDGKPILDKNGRPQSAPFPSAVVIYRRWEVSWEVI